MNLKLGDIIIAVAVSMVISAIIVGVALGPPPEPLGTVTIDSGTSTNVLVSSNVFIKYIYVTNIEYSVIVVGDKRQPTNKPPIQPTAEAESEPDRVVRELIAEGMTRDEAVDTYKRWMEWARIKGQTELRFPLLEE